MRKITYGGACSLDNYFAGPDDAMDWLQWSDELNGIVADYWKNVDTVLMGRKTYQVSLRMGGGPVSGMTNYVFSRTLAADSAPGFIVVASDAVDFVRELKEKAGKDICLMGGGVLAKPLFEGGLIDEIGLHIHPVLLGSGSPAIPPVSRRIGLELIESRTFKNGGLLVSYRVK